MILESYASHAIREIMKKTGNKNLEIDFCYLFFNQRAFRLGLLFKWMNP